ncbi:hypothetical protein H9638_05940 [Arthrobacter sp. Sa2BUA2]|uniref:Uncharacterized protein n=1 Tax=Arthrobacter pullicola TaxID=2762224 RepID=A0ABR8YGK1_9MICC|nr:hypothetical protein [Arthrobacter pullicola]MBD8043351.1 hypothetical protein [Arthrobacter pullicola]
MNTSAGSVWEYSPSGYRVEVSGRRRYRKYSSTAGQITTRQRGHNAYKVKTLAELLDNGNIGSSRGDTYPAEYRYPDSLYGNWQDHWQNTLTER